VEAVFKSWMNERAIIYRRREKIADNLGTAVNVQTMVFGNMGEDSGTGVAFSRDVATGENVLYGEFLMNAQGEDVVAGVRTPVKIAELQKVNAEVYAQFAKIAQDLEKHYADVMDIEFTVEKGRLFILQCRVGKRTAAAAVKVAVDLVHEGVIDKDTAISRVEPSQIYQLLLPRFDPKEKERAKSPRA
jgi:pyruvate,orthophosphate dikinase